MTIEKVTIDDAEELLAIYAPYVRDTAVSFEYVVPSVEDFADRILQISAKYPYIKAVEDGKIIGYAYANTFKGRKAYDWSVETTVYVRKDAKRNGTGRRLYECLEQSLMKMGVLNMNACIASAKVEDEFLTNDSMYFHSRMGFTEVGRFHNSGYKFGRWYDMIWMEKLIGSHDAHPGEVRFGEWDISGEWIEKIISYA
ncbi:MAG: N-acetyltransferase family protein [Lachnospiraceae bacterium]|nr:N-acetyltransferase family protein [Lachnospiraceae bacterium]